MRLRIAEVCQELGYVPNHAASALASARSQTIVVLIPSLSNVVFVDIINGIKEVLDEQGYHLLIGVTGYSPDAEEALLRKYLQHLPDGLILTGIDHNPGVWELLRAQGMPTVHTIETLEGSDGMSVGFSQFESGYAAGRHLVERGRKRIGIVGAQLDPRSLRRCEGCRQALRDAGLYDPALEIMTPEKSSIALGAALLETLLAGHPDCDALFSAMTTWRRARCSSAGGWACACRARWRWWASMTLRARPGPRRRCRPSPRRATRSAARRRSC